MTNSELRACLLSKDGTLDSGRVCALTSAHWQQWIKLRLRGQDPVLEFDPEQVQNPGQLFVRLCAETSALAKETIHDAVRAVLSDELLQMTANPFRLSVFRSRVFHLAAQIHNEPVPILSERLRVIADRILQRGENDTTDSTNDALISICDLLVNWRLRPPHSEKFWHRVENYTGKLPSGNDRDDLFSLLCHAFRLSGWKDFFAYVSRHWTSEDFQQVVDIQLFDFLSGLVRDSGPDMASQLLKGEIRKRLFAAGPVGVSINEVLSVHGADLGLLGSLDLGPSPQMLGRKL